MHLKTFYFAILMKVIFLWNSVVAMDHFVLQAFSTHWFEAWLTLEITRDSFFSNIYCWHFFYSAKQSIAFGYLTFTDTYKPYQRWHALTKSPAFSQQLPITINLCFLPLQIRNNIFLIFLYCALQFQSTVVELKQIIWFHSWPIAKARV